MLRTWKSSAVFVSAGFILSAVSAGAFAGGTDGVKDPVLEKLNKMEKRLDEAFRRISEDMTAVKAEALVAKTRLQDAQDKIEQLQTDLKEARRDLVQMRVEMNELKKRPGTTTQSLYPPEKTSSDKIADRLAKVEQDLARLGTSLRVANSPPGVPPAAGARVKMVNSSLEELFFVINGRTYRVLPSMTQVLEQVPPGPINYEVISPTWGVRGRNSPTLNPGETLTVTAP
jgi:hypothetical protein